MFRFEEKIIKWIESKLYLFSIIAITIAAVFIRYSLRELESPDYISFYENWYYDIKKYGGFHSLGSRVGDYNMLFQFMVAVLTYIPIEPLYAYKIQSCIFDFASAILVSLIVQNITGEKHSWKIFAAYTLVLCSPVVFLNSAGWAQCDMIYTFFIILTFFFLLNEKAMPAMFFYGIAFALKMQAVVFLPFILFVYFIRKKFTALQFIWIPIAMIISSVPCLLEGRDIRELYWVYLYQTNQYCTVHMNYPSFWAILNSEQYTSNWQAFKGMTLGVTVVVLAIIMIMIVVYNIKMEKQNLLYIAFVLSYATVLFLPSMHERYGFVYEIFAIIIVVLNKKTAPLFASLLFMSCCTYGRYLYGTEINIPVLAILNVCTFLLYLLLLGRDMLKNSRELIA